MKFKKLKQAVAGILTTAMLIGLMPVNMTTAWAEETTVTEIIENKSTNPNTIIIENSSKDEFLTLKDYAFVVGTDAPAITLLEVNK